MNIPISKMINVKLKYKRVRAWNVNYDKKLFAFLHIYNYTKIVLIESESIQ